MLSVLSLSGFGRPWGAVFRKLPLIFHSFFDAIFEGSWPDFPSQLASQNLTKRERKAYLINFRYVFRCGANSAD